LQLAGFAWGRRVRALKDLGVHVDEASERRAKYFGDVSSAVDRHRSRGFEYEKEAIA
jgi:hypothetical protein